MARRMTASRGRPMRKPPNGPLLRLADAAINRCQAKGIAPPFVQELTTVGFMAAVFLTTVDALQNSVTLGAFIALIAIVVLLHSMRVMIPYLRHQARGWDRVAVRMAYREQARRERASPLSRLLRVPMVIFAVLELTEIFWLGIREPRFAFALYALHAYVIAAVPEEPKPQEDGARALVHNPV